MDGALDAYAGTNDPCSEQTVALSRLGVLPMCELDSAIGWQHGDVCVSVCSRTRTLMSAWRCFCPTLSQPWATHPHFFDNLHFEHFDKSVNHESRLTLLSKCSKWRLSKKWGWVAHGCDRVGQKLERRIFSDATHWRAKQSHFQPSVKDAWKT